MSRVVAVPELYGPSVHGIPLGDEGFIRFDRFGQVPGCGPVFAAGDATDFALKQGGVGLKRSHVAVTIVPSS